MIIALILEQDQAQKHKRGQVYFIAKRVSQEMRGALSNSHCLVIEANHDLEMIKNNPPSHSNWKQHLSNEAAAEAVVRIIKN